MTQVITTARVSSGWARGTTAPEGSRVVRGLVDRARGGPALAGAVAALGPRWSGGAWGGGAEVAGPAEAGGAFACLPCGPVFLLPRVTVTGSLAGPTAQLLWPRCPPSPFRRHPFYLKERLAAKPWPLGRERSPDGLATGEAVTRETPDSVRRQACRPGSQGEVGLGSICCQHVTVRDARRPRDALAVAVLSTRPRRDQVAMSQAPSGEDPGGVGLCGSRGPGRLTAPTVGGLASIVGSARRPAGTRRGHASPPFPATALRGAFSRHLHLNPPSQHAAPEADATPTRVR